MIHSIRVNSASNLTYSNQYIHTPRYLTELLYNRTLFLNTRDKKGLVGIVKTLLAPLTLEYLGLTHTTHGAANMNLVVLGNRIYACDEGSAPFAIHWNDDNTFDSKGYELSDSKAHSSTHSLTHSSTHSSTLPLPMSSHPVIDIKTQIMYYTGFSTHTHTHTHMDTDKPAAMYGSAYGTNSLQLIDYTDVMLPSRPWIHDMMITERYILLLCGSIVYDSTGILTGDLLKFDSSVKFEVGVASKDDADFVVGATHTHAHSHAHVKQQDSASKSLQWFRGRDAAAIMHVANAWEEVDANNDTVIIIWAPICTGHFDSTLMKKQNRFYMSRVALNLQTGQMRKGTLGTEYNIEYPVVHPAYRGYRSKYVFASIYDSSGSTDDDEEEPIGMIKYNLFDKVIEKTVYFASGVFSGEMVPLPKAVTVTSRECECGSECESECESDKAISDGSDLVYLASFFFNSITHSSEWRVYDGECMSEEPIAVFGVPARVPYGSHGKWIKEEVLQSIINDF